MRLPFCWTAAMATAALVALAAAPRTSHALKVCDVCVDAGNDTTFTPGRSGMGTDIAERAAFPAIGFVGADSVLRCARTATGSWQIQVVQPGVKAGGCSLALDLAREPMIAYHDMNGMLMFAHPVGNGWAYEPVDPTSFVTGSTAIARTPGGAGIAYVDVGTGLLKYAEQNAGGMWIVQQVAAAGNAEAYPSLLVDGPLRAISYYDATQGDLRLAQSVNAATWSSELVDGAGNVGGYSSLVGGSGPGFGIAYYDFTNSDLRWARSLAGGGWATQTLDGAADRVGRFASAVALGGSPDDHVGIAYYDQTHGALKYALELGGTWNTMVVDAASDAGGAGVRGGGTPVPGDTAGIAYVDRTNGDLEYLRIVNGVASVPVPVAGRAELRVEWLRGTSGGGRVRFSVPAAGPVRVSLCDAQGRLTAVPLRGVLPQGPAEVRWDGRDDRGARVGAGAYFVRVETVRMTGSALAIVLR